jgi:hypothetical protein
MPRLRDRRQDMDGLIGAPYFYDCGMQFFYPVGRYIGGAGHELGHALGLSHPPGCDAGLPSCDYAALMWAGYVSYPATYLSARAAVAPAAAVAPRWTLTGGSAGGEYAG